MTQYRFIVCLSMACFLVVFTTFSTTGTVSDGAIVVRCALQSTPEEFCRLCRLVPGSTKKMFVIGGDKVFSPPKEHEALAVFATDQELAVTENLNFHNVSFQADAEFFEILCLPRRNRLVSRYCLAAAAWDYRKRPGCVGLSDEALYREEHDKLYPFPPPPPSIDFRSPVVGQHPTVAFLFMTRGTLEACSFWKRYLDVSSDKQQLVHSYIHRMNFHDVKCLANVPNVNYLNENQTAWGKWGELMNIEFALLEEAMLNSSHSHFVFLSGNSLAIRPKQIVYDSIQSMKRSNFCHMFASDRWERSISVRIPRKFVSYTSQWCILTRQDAELILRQRNYVENTLKFNKFGIADELYLASHLKIANRNPEMGKCHFYVTWKIEKGVTPWPRNTPKRPFKIGIVEEEWFQSLPQRVLFIRKSLPSTRIRLSGGGHWSFSQFLLEQ